MKEIGQRLREFGMIGRALVDRDRPILAQVVPMRRCNLACSYCNEYDKVSAPVTLPAMLARIDRLAELGTGIVTISGGEPMMHPDLDAIIARIRGHGMLTGLITNGFYLNPERISRLNGAGLEYLQISIDNVEPDENSKKSLKSLDRKLQHLAAHARFHVNINAVVGGDLKNPEDALVIVRRAAELGFSSSVGLLHDHGGQMKPLDARQAAVFKEALSMGRQLYTRINTFQMNLIAGRPNAWHCLAGARYLYICEEGLVHYCSQQRGRPGIPLADYGVAHIREAFAAPKTCAAFCNIGCVHRASSLDNTLQSFGLRRFPAPDADLQNAF